MPPAQPEMPSPSTGPSIPRPLPGRALYWGGVAANRAGEPLRAILLWELLIDEFEDSTFRPNALLQAAEGFAAQSDYQPAVAYLNELSRPVRHRAGRQARARRGSRRCASSRPAWMRRRRR